MGEVYNTYFLFRMSPMSNLSNPALSLTSLLRYTRQLDITEPRDRLYGLLDLATEPDASGSHSFVSTADYTITEGDLWKQHAW